MGKHLALEKGVWERKERVGGFPAATRQIVFEDHGETTAGTQYPAGVNMRTEQLAIGHRVSYQQMVEEVRGFLNATRYGANKAARDRIKTFVNSVLAEQAAMVHFAYDAAKKEEVKNQCFMIKGHLDLVIQFAERQPVTASWQPLQVQTFDSAVDILIDALNRYIGNLSLSDAPRNGAIHQHYDGRVEQRASGQYGHSPITASQMESGVVAAAASPSLQAQYVSHGVGGTAEMGRRVDMAEFSPLSQARFQACDKHPIKSTHFLSIAVRNSSPNDISNSPPG